ncbi:MAG: site-specific integrase [Eubacteriales bacterium]|nr:site-specific integrase [Eubacteriales bacterium]
MPSYYDEKTKTWYCKFYYTDYTDTKKQKLKRGFKLQREAKEWERSFLLKQSAEPTMPFPTLCQLYLDDKKEHNKLITYETKKNRVEKWLLPYFEKCSIDSISAADIRKWQADLKNSVNANGQPLSPGYMQNLVTELSSVFNFAVRFYGLSVNPCRVAGNTVGQKQKSLNFWTKEEFDRFIDTFEHSDPYHTAFLILYYCGLRIGEFEALTAADIDTKENTITINKTYHLINGEGVVTSPKTAKANRTIIIPVFLSECIQRYKGMIYGITPETRLFLASHSSYARQLEAHTKAAGVKRIRLHDIRHSHASLLIEMGFSALLVSERLGHEDVSTTLNIYSHLFPSKQLEVAEKLDKLCQNNSY